MAGEVAAAQTAATAVDTAIDALRTAVANYRTAVTAAMTAGALSSNDGSLCISNWALGALIGRLGVGMAMGSPAPGAPNSIASSFDAPVMPVGPTFASVVSARLR